MIKRIKFLIEQSRKADKRKMEIEKLLETEKDAEKIFRLQNEYENLGAIGIYICKICNIYRSDLEWRVKGQKGAKCSRCGSNKIMSPPQIPVMAIIKLVIRFLIKGF
jgi:hypothetical protein